MLKLHRFVPTASWWETLASAPDRLIYQTREWMQFVADTQQASPVWAEVCDGASVVGYFSGLVFSRLGVKVLGSPFPGWQTMYMGFNLQPGVPRWLALQALAPFAFRELGCLHLETVDRYLAPEDGDKAALAHSFVDTYETDLTQTEDQIFGAMESACRRCIRKAEKSGVLIEEAADADFARQYYEQLKDVFLKQGLVPPYGRARVEKLIAHLQPTGRLLLLRARDPEGHSIATGIYPGMNTRAQFWGNASFRSGQHFRPNEALHWYAMRCWKRRGVAVFDWGGGGQYKEKYGCSALLVPRFHQSRFRLLGALRNAAQKFYARKQQLQGRLASARGRKPPASDTQ